MKDEIRVAVEFLRQFIAKYGRLNEKEIDLVADKLSKTLQSRFINHWYEDKPLKGQAYRCLRLKRSEDYMDPVLEQILKHETGFNLNQLGLPNDFTLWIDPGEVSVRFGDQVGYTYTIARLNRRHSSAYDKDETVKCANNFKFYNGNKRQQQQQLDEKDLSDKEQLKAEQEQNKENINDNKNDDDVQSNANDNSPSTLIVEKTENIFDEKLTAFIRQNSSSAGPAVTLPAVKSASPEIVETSKNQCSVLFDDDFSMVNTKELPVLSTLSAEQRTISPPLSSSFLNNGNVVNGLNKANKREVSSMKPIGIKLNTNAQANAINAGSYGNNRLSFNDSCYFSSSSSSCASSYDSNHSENLLQAVAAAEQNWNKPQFGNIIGNTKKPTTASQLFPGMSSNSFGLASGTSNTSANSAAFEGLYSLELDNYNFGNLTDQQRNACHFGISSETSSDRSDTPNSCMTSSSYSFVGPSSSSSSIAIPGAYFETMNTNRLNGDSSRTETNSGLVDNKQTSGSLTEPVSSSSSTSTSSSATISHMANNNNNKNERNDDVDDKYENVVSNENVIEKELIELTSDKKTKSKKTGTKKTGTSATKKKKDKSDTKKTKSKPAPASSPTPSSCSQQSPASDSEKKCGYVESFPYYYKLNRLYNALAVQKLQTERLKKSTLTSTGPSQSVSPVPFVALQQHGGNVALRNRTNNTRSMHAESPSVIQRRLMLSPTASQASSPSSSTLTPQQMSMFGGSKNSSHLNVSPSSSNKLTAGYPMSSFNAALSFANHQNRNINIQQQQQNIRSQSGFKNNSLVGNSNNNNNINNNSITNNNNNNNNNTFGLNIDSLFSTSANSNPTFTLTSANNYNSSTLFSSSLNSPSHMTGASQLVMPASSDSNLLFAHQQQQQQQQLFNMFSQMNWMHGQQDLLHSK